MTLMTDLDTFLRAIAQVESNGGANDYPRFEASYAPKDARFTVQGRVITGTGRNFNDIVRGRWNAYGMASACSFSPWQILYHAAADLGYSDHPVGLWRYPEIARHYVVAYVERQLKKGVNTVEGLADAYNSGNAHDAIVPTEYISKVVAAYEVFAGDTLRRA